MHVSRDVGKAAKARDVEIGHSSIVVQGLIAKSLSLFLDDHAPLCVEENVVAVTILARCNMVVIAPRCDADHLAARQALQRNHREQILPDGYVAGGRSDQANITLDGVDVNEQQTGDAFSPVLRVSPDTVEEFRVTTTNPNASQGRSSGAQVELITKHGDNDWHGNLFEYHRNTVFTANDLFNNSTIIDGKSLPRPVLLRNNFGGSLTIRTLKVGELCDDHLRLSGLLRP